MDKGISYKVHVPCIMLLFCCGADTLFYVIDRNKFGPNTRCCRSKDKLEDFVEAGFDQVTLKLIIQAVVMIIVGPFNEYCKLV